MTTIIAYILVLLAAAEDLAALCDQGGTNQSARVAAQYTYDAYGDVVTTDHIHAHAYAHLGHKCLFVDRLDIGVSAGGNDTPRLVPFAQHVYQNRNRAYSPALGRYLQRDPNESGLVLLDSLAYHGETPTVAPSDMDLSAQHADGSNLYAYLGSNPWTRGDPLGLFITWLLPGPSDFITGALQSLVTEYAANLEWDVEWAGDWETGDDWHSRLDASWIVFALIRGVYDAYWIGIPFTDIGVNPLDRLAGGKRKTPRGARTPGGSARFSHVVEVDGKRAVVFHNPRGGRKLVRFDRDAIRRTEHVTPSNYAKEIADANRKYPAPKDHIWHHHWKPGVMQLVPRKLHERAGHIGRRQFWPPERPAR
jgi:hypothetical protein